MKKKWPVLKKGDVVDIVAPGWKCEKVIVKQAIEFLKSWGLVARFDSNQFSNDVLFSNSDQIRFQYLKKALLNSRSKAIWCVRGGSGTHRLLPYLEELEQPSLNKVVIGISDITTLHHFLLQRWNWISLHATLLDRIGQGRVPQSILTEMQNVLFGLKKELIFNNLKPLNEKAKQNLSLRGELIGGNLTVLQASLSTPWQLKTKNKIIFFEEIGERAYRVDRILVHFEQAGLFKNVKAIVFGEFLVGKEKSGRDLTPIILKQFAERMNFPVFKGLQSGHGKIQRVVPIGSRAILSSDDSASLVVQSGGQ